MRYIDLKPLSEAPIEDFNTIGDFDKSSSFRKPIDRKLVTLPKSVAKIKAKWSKTQFPFNMYFVTHVIPQFVHSLFSPTEVHSSVIGRPLLFFQIFEFIAHYGRRQARDRLICALTCR
jgi:hypothetical protein